jgi:hypothetical protein
MRAERDLIVLSIPNAMSLFLMMSNSHEEIENMVNLINRQALFQSPEKGTISKSE